MPEERKSFLYHLEPIARKLPSVAKPKGHVHFRKKLLWTLLILILYFFLRQVPIYGLSPRYVDIFASYRAIMGGASGSIIHLGIGPLVTGSIIMQLFVGAKIFKLDLTKPDDRRVYQSVQRLMMVLMIVVEAIPQVFGYLNPSSELIGAFGLGVARAIIVLQLILGGMIVLWFDEIVSKWGIGSGISLFILAGVAQAIFVGLFNWIPVDTTSPISLTNPPSGVIPKTIYILSHSTAYQLVSGGGFERIFFGYPNSLIALIGTIIIFVIVVYAEGTRVMIPLSHARVRGARGAYPIRLLYPSNIPVILISALLADLNALAYILWSRLGTWWFGGFHPGSTRPTMGFLWYINGPRGIQEWLLPLLDPRYSAYMYGHEWWQLIVRVATYLTFMILGAIVFSILWVESTGMSPRDIARQIVAGGLQIPGFRTTERSIARFFERYIPAVTVLGGAIVGLLAAMAQIIGTVGNVSGTGVLLAVSIAIRYSEMLAREQLAEMHPLIRRFIVGE